MAKIQLASELVVNEGYNLQGFIFDQQALGRNDGAFIYRGVDEALTATDLDGATWLSFVGVKDRSNQYICTSDGVLGYDPEVLAVDSL